jgi:hypothetical protein
MGPGSGADPVVADPVVAHPDRMDRQGNQARPAAAPALSFGKGQGRQFGSWPRCQAPAGAWGLLRRLEPAAKPPRASEGAAGLTPDRMLHPSFRPPPPMRSDQGQAWLRPVPWMGDWRDSDRRRCRVRRYWPLSLTPGTHHHSAAPDLGAQPCRPRRRRLRASQEPPLSAPARPGHRPLVRARSAWHAHPGMIRD